MKLRSLALWIGILPLALGATLFAACGGDDDGGGSTSGGGGGTGSDEQFVAGFCKAFASFAKASEDATKNLNTTNPKDIADKLVKPYEDFANDFSKLKPPKDLQDWHSETSKSMKDSVKALKSGDEDAAALSADFFPEPPAGAAERLSKAAGDNKDCQEAGAGF